MTEESIYIPTREEWRSWLQENHDREERIWLIYYKKHTGKPSIPYNDAVEEALCFGWVDSLVRRIDDERYMQKYTPRKPKSSWSKHNVRRVKKMIEKRKMTGAGLELYEYAERNGLLPDMEESTPAKGMIPDAPDYFTDALRKNHRAREFFDALAPSFKLQFLGWIMDAKKEETRKKRLAESIALLESGKKLGMK